jgi:hypothetical protein
LFTKAVNNNISNNIIIPNGTTTNYGIYLLHMFSQHPRAIFWSERNLIKPNEVALNSHNKFWFDCECGHTFDIQLNNVNSGRWCSYCSNKKLCEPNKNCKTK